MKKASEYRKVHKGSNTLEQKYAHVLEIIHKELEINAERGINSIKVCIPICEDDFSGDGCYNAWTETYEVYECIKCGKKKYKYIK